MNRLFFDYNSTTPVREEVFQEMAPFFSEEFGNPSSVHRWGQRGREAVENARGKVAEFLGADPGEILFTSGGSEANSLALIGSAWNVPRGKGHLIISSIEHPSILNSASFLERNGFRITRVRPEASGVLSPQNILQELREDTILISLMHSNNETGVLQPVEEVCRLAHERGIGFHTDAVQSAGKVRVDVRKIGADLLSLSAHKFYGPKGVGALYLKKGTDVAPLIFGGGQERGLRGGTEMVPQVAGMGAAAFLASREVDAFGQRLAELRDTFEKKIKGEISGAEIPAEKAPRLPNTSSLLLKGVDAHSLMIALDLEGIAVSTGSACHSGTVEPSHVLLDMGIGKEDALSILRISFGRRTTPEEVGTLMAALKKKMDEARMKKKM